MSCNEVHVAGEHGVFQFCLLPDVCSSILSDFLFVVVGTDFLEMGHQWDIPDETDLA